LVVMPACCWSGRWFLHELHLQMKALFETDAKNNMINFSYLFIVSQQRFEFRNSLFKFPCIYIYIMSRMPRVNTLVWEISVEIMNGTSNFLQHALSDLKLTIHSTLRCIILV
jgi:hypothetical protein